MKTARTNKNIGSGLSPSAFEDDGIPNSPFKSSKSAALTFATFGILFGGLFVVCGTVMAISHPQKNAPAQAVQRVKTHVPAPLVAVAENSGKRYTDPAHATAKHLKRHAKPKSSAHAKQH